jgi:hypothetical protein
MEGPGGNVRVVVRVRGFLPRGKSVFGGVIGALLMFTHRG